MQSPGGAEAPRIRIAWHGQFSGEGSLARVNRLLARALLAQGGVDVIPCGEPTPAVEALLGLPARRLEDIPADDAARVTLRHRWPPRFLAPAGGPYVHVQPWEYGAAPVDWMDALRGRADDVWCYTEHVRRTYVESGMPADRTHVIPLGFDPAVYHRDIVPFPLTPAGTCTFVCVGGLVPRKNITATINAYLTAFRPGDRVVLLIKDNPALGVYDDRANNQLRALAARTDIPPIRYLDAQYTDADMARLYRTAAALVHSYRGEGFSLPVLEAMACGTPAIVTAGGATDDFVDESVGYRVPATRTPVGTSVDGLTLAAEGWWLEIDVAALASTMREVFERRSDAAARGARAATRAHAGWTWAHAAQVAAGRLTALVEVPARASRMAEAIEDYDRSGVGAPNGMDQLLEELFARIRSDDPFYLDVAAEPGAFRNGLIFGTRYDWRGCMLAPTDEEATRLRDLLRDNECVRIVRSPPDPRSISEALHASRPPGTGELDLLALRGVAPAVWEALAPARPRIVVTPTVNAFAPSLHAAGYALLGTNKAGTDAVYARPDIAPLTGFRARAAASAGRLEPGA